MNRDEEKAMLEAAKKNLPMGRIQREINFAVHELVEDVTEDGLILTGIAIIATAYEDPEGKEDAEQRQVYTGYRGKWVDRALIVEAMRMSAAALENGDFEDGEFTEQ